MHTLISLARRPLFLLVLLTAVLTGLTVVWWLLPLGLGCYLAAVTLAARDPAQRAGVERAVARQQLTSPTFRAAVDEIDRAQHELQRCVEGTRGPLLRLLAGVTAQTSALVDQAHALAQKGQRIEHYLAGVDAAQLQRQLGQLEAELGRTTDRYTQEQLRETLAALRDQQSNVEGLKIYRGRISAQLQNIAANLRKVYAETVQLAASAPGDVASEPDVAERLRDLNADMAAFQRVLDSALAGSGAA